MVQLTYTNQGCSPEAGVPDMTVISDIDESGINKNLRVRYDRDQIYTYTGSILVAVNPYKDIDIYTSEYVFRYHGAKLGSLEPHVFALAEAAYRSLQDSATLSIQGSDSPIDSSITSIISNQSCVISGESGAGKTETTKFILQYLCSVTSNVSTWVEQQILEANTILEAFGNAKTVRNDNSSRFGKFMQICFDAKFEIRGCIIQDYLLEQSRITFQSRDETNYHVFYQLIDFAKTNETFAKSLHLRTDTSFYKYLNGGGTAKTQKHNERKLDSLRLAFQVLQVPSEMADGIFKVLAAILWLGNLEFQDIDGEKCQLSDSANDGETLECVADLLGLDLKDVLQVCLTRQINVRGNITEIPLKLQEARENRHAMAKALYSRTFAWLVSHINTCTNPGQDATRFLGVLDIFGFENFVENSFEQLCINYTNEKLHKFFNHYVFALEQEIYQQEEIQFAHIQFTDNTQCLELIERPPRCLLKLLTEQCHMPKGSDQNYLLNLHLEFENHKSYFKGDDRRKWENSFGIIHYAGCVTYQVRGFVDKNRDVQQDVFFDYMQRSDNLFVQELTGFQDLLTPICKTPNGGTVSRNTSKGKPTVSDSFRHQLQALVDVLQSTTPWYVRCIKPNNAKVPDSYNSQLVLDQLKYLGMLDIIRIRRSGYPVHMSFDEFMTRYASLRPKSSSTIRDLLSNYATGWQIGKSKVFLQKSVHEPLEEARIQLLTSKAVKIQKVWRGYKDRKMWIKIQDAVYLIQHAYKGWKMRILFIRKRRAAIVLQKHLRGVFAREVAAALREMRRVEEEMRKREEQERRKEEEKVLEESERLVQEEILHLSQLSSQLKMTTSPTITESVDLDNLFAFLSDVTPPAPVIPTSSSIIDEIGTKMDELVEDLDLELEQVIQQELEDFGRQSTTPEAIKPVESKLPEPTEPPPPPPIVIEKEVPLTPPSSPANSGGKEPIYESVLPRNEDEVPAPIPFRNEEPEVVIPPLPPIEDPRDQRRLKRIEKKLQELDEPVEIPDPPDLYHDIVEFAQLYFNTHEKTPDGTLIQRTLTRKSKIETIPKYEMCTYTKSQSIPNSHIKLYDPDNIAFALQIWRDLQKYMKGEAQQELSIIQNIIKIGIEREEMRDEILIQLIRQSTNTPNIEWLERVWLLLCLTITAFQPSKLLFKYFVSFLKKQMSIMDDGAKLKQYVQWCLDNCSSLKVGVRKYPPSAVEVAAMRRLGTIVCRFFFLDGRTKAIDVHPTDTAADATHKLSDRLNLKSTDGWAIYQSRPDGEEHVRAHYYLYDVIAEWENKQIVVTPTTMRRSAGNNAAGAATMGSGENRFIFKRRLFKNTRDLSQDPVEVHLLYAQAVYNVVKCDAFPVTEKVALQLAGLQAQVALGNPTNRLDYYSDIDTYLPYRISRSRGDDVWVPILADAHCRYGSERSELTAKALYLTCVMQYPLYGTTTFSVTYRGYWTFPTKLLLGIASGGVQFIKIDDKNILLSYRYDEIESILIDPADSFITLNVLRNDKKCFVFETDQKTEIASLIVSYAPSLKRWLCETYEEVRTNKIDKARLFHNLVMARRGLVDTETLRKPTESGGFLRNTLRKLKQPKEEPEYKGFSYNFWAFTRTPITQSILRLPEPNAEAAIQLFATILQYSQSTEIRREEEEHLFLIQTIFEIAMENDARLCELYLQLIKQTTDHPDPNSRVNIRNWALLSLACSVVLPPNKAIRKYLIAHLRRCSADFVTEEGKFARFAEKCLQKTQGTRRRRWPPSCDEITCTINRRPIYARFHFMDGQYHSIEFSPSAISKEVIELIKAKIGLPPEAQGYAIYEVLGQSERSLIADEKIADVLSKWEKFQNGTQNVHQNGGRKQRHLFLFKKHLFLDRFLNLDDPVEKELLYHQVLHDLRGDRFPITEKEAMMLTSLQAQLELGDMGDLLHDYRPIAAHCLPPRFVPDIPSEGVALHHQSLRGMTPTEAKKAFLNLIQSWPLHRATIFDVMQSFTSNWPRVLWLAVDQVGLHLLEHRSRNALCTYEYSTIISYSPAINCLMIITGSDKKQSKVILTTSQAFQIATLIREYTEVFQSDMMTSSITSQQIEALPPPPPPHQNLPPQLQQQRSVQRSRPVSILHKPAPLIEPQPS